jgi:Uma2 family endonuclease
MGLPAAKRRHSIQEYYRIENDSAEKHEFRDGEILAMSGGSPQHALIAANISGELRNRVRGKPCQPYSSDLRVRIGGEEQTIYPDVSIICGGVKLDPDDKSGHSVLNPRVIIEVLSPSTEAYDRGAKFAAYRNIESLDEYVLVSHDQPRVETFLRQDDGTWKFTPFTGIDAIVRFQSLHVEVPLAEIYSNVVFSTSEAPDMAQ